MADSVSNLIIGHSQRQSQWYMISAGGIFVLVTIFLSAPQVIPTIETTFDLFDSIMLLLAIVLFFISITASIVQSYQNHSLLASWTLGVAPILGFYVFHTTVGGFYPKENLLWGIYTGLQFGTPLGVIGFLLGRGGKRIRNRLAR